MADVEFEAGSDDDETSPGVPATPSSSKGRSGQDPSEQKTKTKARRLTQKKTKGSRVCKACQKTCENHLFQLNQVVCVACKKALDVISKKAKAQKASQWLKDIKADPKKLKNMVHSYQAAVAMPAVGASARPGLWLPTRSRWRPQLARSTSTAAR